MDIEEFNRLAPEPNESNDLSMMINAQRRANGAKGEQWLLNR